MTNVHCMIIIVKTIAERDHFRVCYHSYLVPALSHESLEMRQDLTCLSPAYTVCICTLPHIIENSHFEQSILNL